MNIIICGAGRVGFTIAKLLGEQGHSITVIDQSSEDILKIEATDTIRAINSEEHKHAVREFINLRKRQKG